MNAETFYPLFLKAQKCVIDSRKIEKDDLFFAFSGDNFNAATLAEDAHAKGALAVIVEQKEFENLDKNIFYVPSTLTFLQELAFCHRNHLNIPVIALTGSNGKTTTKEIIQAVLSQKFNVQFTHGNLNNHIGVPLTLLSIKPTHDIAVIEMGANHQGEIEKLCEIAQPDFGYITNFGKAHLEGFGGFEGVIKGKTELYNYLISNRKTILINDQDALQVEKSSAYGKKVSFGKSDSTYNFEEISRNNFVGLKYKEEEALSNLTGNYNYSNLCAAATLGLYFGVEWREIKKAVHSYQPTNMRSQIVRNGDQTLLLDTYNANPSSMAESLRNFTTFVGRKTVIIGDMLELGGESATEHQNIVALAESLNFEDIITVGENFINTNSKAISFGKTEELISFLKEHKILSDNILLKGSRGIALEQILPYLD